VDGVRVEVHGRGVFISENGKTGVKDSFCRNGA
jgi:hypothetical protein